MRITSARAIEVLDSRGRPTLQVEIATADGLRFGAGVPSGASTGAAEAVERRDGDASRYGGYGVQAAVAAVGEVIAPMLAERDWRSLEQFDQALSDLDGTPTKSALGANAIVGVSMAAARAFAAATDSPLYEYLGAGRPRLPVPCFNVLNGGAHARNALEFQEFMIAPVGAPSLADAVRAGAEIYAALQRVLADAGMATGLGDEGGFAPEVDSPEQACELLVAAIAAAGYDAGTDSVAVALDPAANGFLAAPDRYVVGGAALSPVELVERYAELTQRFPIWSIEDGCAETDEVGWRALTNRLGEHIQLVGDDIFVTDPTKIERAATTGIANAALIKVNQIGTVSETLQAIATCRRVRFGAMISHRSGETPDDFIADLAVGSGVGQLKSGAPARGERVAKYNRLLAIAAGEPALPYGLPDR